METLLLEDVKLKLKQIIVHELDADISIDRIGDDLLLCRSGIGLDSLSMVNLLVLAEKTFGVDFDDEALNSAVFSCVNNLSHHILQKS